MSSESGVVGDSHQNPEEALDGTAKNATNVEGPENGTWQKNEKQLHNKIAEYETAFVEEKHKIAALQKDLQARTEERDNFKNQVTKLEKELAKRSLQGSKGEDVNSDDMVTKARSVIFEKTKVCKNQELQIEALTQQVKSLKEIQSISKDMLDIRNMEVKQLQEQMNCMELKFTVEKDRQALMHTKLERMIKLNEQLKAEYQNQLALFTQLQQAYHKKDNLTLQNGESSDKETTN